MVKRADLKASAKTSRMARALRRSEDRFRQVVEHAPNAFVLCRSDGRIEMVNAQTEVLFGYDRAEMIGRPVEILMPERFRRPHADLRQMFFAHPATRPIGAGRELVAQRKDGSEFPAEIGLNPIGMDEGPAVLAAIVDISDRRQKDDRLRAALHEKSLLLNEIHHRVKNNLQVIDGLLALQATRSADPRVRSILIDCRNRVASMILIHRLLYGEANLTEIGFTRFLCELVDMLQTTFVIDRARIAVRVAADDLHLPIDLAIPLGLVATELVSNALKHGFPDGRAGAVEVALNRIDGGRARLSIADDGIGFGNRPAAPSEDSETLGMRLVAMLTDQIGGRMSCQAKNPTVFSLEFGSRR